MSDEERNADGGAVPLEQPTLDEHTTEPNAAPQTAHAAAPARGKWEMPKPKFQQTSGYLPQGYLKDVQEQAAGTDFIGSEEPTEQQSRPHTPVPPSAVNAAPSAVAAMPDVEPQPDLDDGIIVDETESVTVAAPAEAKKGTSVVMLVLGLAGILIFVAVFLVAVYFLYLAKP